MNCKRCQLEIEEVGVGAESLSRQAQAHLSACPSCRAFHDERQSLRRLIGSLEPVSAPADFDYRLRARINATKAAGGNGFSWRSFLASAPALGLAASFALLVAGVVFYNQLKSGPAADRNEIASESSRLKSEQERSAQDSSPAPSVTLPAPAASPVEGGVKTVVAGVKRPHKAAPRNGKLNQRQDSMPLTANAAQRSTNELAVNPAPVITPFGQGPNPIVQLPVRSASQPVRVVLDDRKGSKRSLNLEPVVFGSQDLAGRGDARLMTAHGIW